jgi:hypothetical protein
MNVGECRIFEYNKSKNKFTWNSPLNRERSKIEKKIPQMKSLK